MVTVTGKLVSGDNVGLPQATITFKANANSNIGTAEIIQDSQFSTITDSLGIYSLSVNNGSYIILVSIGSTQVTLGTCIIDALTPSPIDILELIAYAGVSQTVAQDILDQAIAAKNAAEAAATSVNYVNVVDISSLLSVNTAIYSHANVAAYHSSIPYTTLKGGGGLFEWFPLGDKSLHNGGSIIDPAIAYPTDWNNPTERLAWFTATGVGTGVWVRQSEEITVENFGAKGDSNGTTGNGTDDTYSIAKACTVARSDTGLNKVVKTKKGIFRITSRIDIYTAGFDMEAVGYGAPSSTQDSYIFVDFIGSTDYGMSITGSPTTVNLAIVGGNKTVNGLLIQNPAIAQFGKIRAAYFDGYGVKINKCWDSTFNHISVEGCGNATEYAFSMNDDGDTCNMSHINRLQVEHAKELAIFVSANTLSCVIDNIHSEAALVTVANTNTWVLGGNRSTYNTFRLNATDGGGSLSANANAILTGSHCTFMTGVTEANIPVFHEGSSGGNVNTHISPEYQGVFAPKPGQVGRAKVIGGAINIVDALYVEVDGTQVTTMTFGTNSDAKAENCAITTVNANSSTSNINLIDCDVTTLNVFDATTGTLNSCKVVRGTVTLAVIGFFGDFGTRDNIIFDGTNIVELTANSASSCATLCNKAVLGALTVAGGQNVGIIRADNIIYKSSLAWDNRTMYFDNTRFMSTITLSNADGRMANCEVDGALSITAGPRDPLYHNNVFKSTTYANAAPAAGTYYVGQRTENIQPAVGSPKAWVCTVAGSPGTWVSEGNL